MLSFEEFCILCLHCHVQKSNFYLEPRSWSVTFSRDTSTIQTLISYEHNVQLDTHLQLHVLDPIFSLQSLSSSSQSHTFEPSDGFKSAYLEFLLQTSIPSDSNVCVTELRDIQTNIQSVVLSPDDKQYVLLDQFPSFQHILEAYCLPYLRTINGWNMNTSNGNVNIHTPYDELIHRVYTALFCVNKKPSYCFPACYDITQQDLASLFTAYKSIQTPCLQLVHCVQCIGFICRCLQYQQQVALPNHPTRLNQFSLCNRASLYELCHKMLFRRQKTMEFVQQFLSSIFDMKDDMQVLTYLRSQYDFFQQFQGQDHDKGQQRLREIERCLSSMFDVMQSKEQLYLDFGGQSGQLANVIQSYFQLSHEQVFVADIRSWSHMQFTPSFNTTWLYSHILPFPNNHFQLITCFQVLHHIHQPLKTIQELYRILKPGGFLLIREHDIRNMEEATITDIEHTLFDFVLYKDRTLEYLQDHFTSYVSKFALRNDMAQHQFVCLHSFSTQPKGPTRYHYDVFQKPI